MTKGLNAQENIKLQNSNLSARRFATLPIAKAPQLPVAWSEVDAKKPSIKAAGNGMFIPIGAILFE